MLVATVCLATLALAPGVMVTADPAGASYPLPEFEDAAEEAGLDFACGGWNKDTGLAPRFFIDLFHCTAPVVADFNGNGFLDVFFPNMRHTNQTANAQNDPQNRLYLNNGDGTFSDVTDILGLRDDAMSLGAAALDYDGDGDLDVYAANYVEIPRGFNDINSPSTTFYRNNGDGTFTLDVPPGLQTGGIFSQADSQWGMAVAVGDHDGDGWLDIYRGNYIRYRITDGMPPGVQATQPDSNNFYRNNADGTFTDIAQSVGASAFEGRSFGVSFNDFSSDRSPDLYVANDQNPNEFYRNRGDGVFLEESFGSGADDTRGSMCAQAADWTGDGDLDLYMTHYENQLNGYYTGNGDGTFTDQSALGDLTESYEHVAWACPALDFDNDGALDLFVANGHMLPTGSQFPGNTLGYEQPNLLFRNTLQRTGTHSFEDVTQDAGPGLQDVFVSGGAQTADFDLDGRAEILVVNSNGERVSYYKNRAEDVGHWLIVEPRADAPNTHAVGAKVTVNAGGLVQVAHRETGGGYGSGSLLPLRFGLGAHNDPVDVTIEWPDGSVETRTIDQVDQIVRIRQGQIVETDTLAPRVDVGIDGESGENDWWTSPQVTIALDATDLGIGATSGTKQVSYRIGDGPVQEYDEPFLLSGDGIHDFTVYATDHAGNSAWYPHRVKIDSVVPDGIITRPVEGKVYAQDRDQGESPTGDTVIITSVRTPDEKVEKADDLVHGTIRSVNDITGFGLPYPPLTGGEILDGTVGSDQYTLVLADAHDATSGIDQVEFHLDGDPLHADRKAPYNWHVDLRGQTAGEHQLSITTTDQAGLHSHHVLPVRVVPTTHDAALNTLMDLLDPRGEP